MFKKLLSLFFLWTLTVPAAYAAIQANDDNLITGASLPSSILVLANDTTDTGNELTVSSFDSASTEGGTVSDNGNGVLSYTPPSSFTGGDSFSYTITDGSGSSASATVAIQVKPATQLTGALAQDTTWTNDNVYLITGDVTVPLGVTLTINAGTVIQFQANSDDTSGGNDTARSELCWVCNPVRNALTKKHSTTLRSRWQICSGTRAVLGSVNLPVLVLMHQRWNQKIKWPSLGGVHDV